MRERTLAAQSSVDKYGRKPRRELFFYEMDRAVPWRSIEALIEPHYAYAHCGWRRDLPVMLRVYLVQQWFKLSDREVEDAMYESASVQRFVGINLQLAPPPDDTTVGAFRDLLEQHGLSGAMLEVVNDSLRARGIRVIAGEIVEATMTRAPSTH